MSHAEGGRLPTVDEMNQARASQVGIRLDKLPKRERRLPPGTEAPMSAAGARVRGRIGPTITELKADAKRARDQAQARVVNPKDIEAQTKGKTRLDLLEPAADEAIADALAFGADKYGVRNYVTVPICARVYVAAMRRHLADWLSGEDVAGDSGLHHLAHIGANVHVAMAAMAAGTFVDDRAASLPNDNPVNGAASIGGDGNVEGA